MDYPKIDTTVGLYNGKFTDGNPAGGIPASKDPSSWANNVTDELLAILAAASITPNETVSNQVVTAIQELINVNIGTIAGQNANNVAITGGYAFFTGAISTTYNLSGITVTTAKPATECGPMMGWNFGGYSETDIINWSMAGNGGFSFYNLTTAAPAPALLLRLDGSGNLVSTGTLQGGSARYLKEGIRTFEPTLADLAAVPLRAFTWIKDGRADYGAIADEVAVSFPELTSPDENGVPASVNYGALSFLIARGLVDHVERQRATIDDLRARLASIESLIERMVGSAE